MSLESDTDFVVFDRRNKWLKFSWSDAVVYVVGNASERQCTTLIEKLSKAKKKSLLKLLQVGLKQSPVILE